MIGDAVIRVSPDLAGSGSVSDHSCGAHSMIPSGMKVFLASHPVDFRNGPDSLLALVRDAGNDSFSGALYVFRAKKAWLWVYACDDTPFGGGGPPMVAYRFEDSRFGDCVHRHLRGYRGILQVNGYAAYSKLACKDGGDDAPLLAGCWAHSRRRFYALHTTGASVATETIEMMTELWTLEATVRGQSPEARVPHARLSPHRLSPRSSRCGNEPCDLPRITGKLKLAEALRYAMTRREIFERL